MNEIEQLRLHDALVSAQRMFADVEQSLGYATTTSNDYEMGQALNGLHNEEEKIREAFPKCWEKRLLEIT